MENLFDILAGLLFAATASLFMLRLRHEHPPLTPYALIGLVCAVSNWLGNHGGGPAAVMLMIAGAFLALHLAGEPYRETPDEKSQ